MNIVPRLRNKKMMPWLLAEFIWRRKHHGDLWGGIMKCLSEIAFRRNSDLEPILTQFTAENITDDDVEDNIDDSEEEDTDESSESDIYSDSDDNYTE